jgi:hypothetical protein
MVPKEARTTAIWLICVLIRAATHHAACDPFLSENDRLRIALPDLFKIQLYRLWT